MVFFYNFYFYLLQFFLCFISIPFLFFVFCFEVVNCEILLYYCLCCGIGADFPVVLLQLRLPYQFLIHLILQFVARFAACHIVYFHLAIWLGIPLLLSALSAFHLQLRIFVCMHAYWLNLSFLMFIIFVY